MISDENTIKILTILITAVITQILFLTLIVYNFKLLLVCTLFTFSLMFVLVMAKLIHSVFFEEDKK